jgi:hypothetical protein
MSHLTEQYEVESGEKALYRIGASDYHTLRYVKWLEAKVELFTAKSMPPCRWCGKTLYNWVCVNTKCAHYGE